MIFFTQSVINGLMTGGVYALIAVGLGLVFGVLHLINFTHGELVIIGGYISYLLVKVFGVNPFVAIPVVILAMILVSYIIQRGLIRRVLNAPHLNQIVLTLGISVVLRNLALMIFTANPQSVSTGYESMGVSFGPIRIGVLPLICFIIAMLVMTLFWFGLKYTNVGKALRAVSQNKDLALLTGVKAFKMYDLAFVIAGVTAGIAGALYVVGAYVSPDLGHSLILKGFAIVILGGVGSFPGAIIGSLMLGIAESMAVSYVPDGSGWTDAIAFIVMIVVLLFRPSGIFGREGRLG